MSKQSEHAKEVASKERFEFGKNWSRFLALLTEERVLAAESSLAAMLETSTLAGKSFLDVGSGSGLFSLAARRLGARVHSLDYDPDSVRCTTELRRRYFPNDPQWTVEEASALDKNHLMSLGQFDVVYSWGVLHHTGHMWAALDNVSGVVAPGGSLFISIYNDQGSISVRWKKIKRLYLSLPGGLRFLVVAPCFAVLWGPRFLKALLRGRPLQNFTTAGAERGMDLWRDMIDWVGGYPFEVAKPEEIFDFYKQRGFSLNKLVTEGGSMGCNQFVFRKHGALLPARGETAEEAGLIARSA